MIPVHVNSHVVFPIGTLDKYLLGAIRGELLILNPVREEQKKQKIWGWHDLPEYIQLYQQQSGWMRAPRGFLPKLTALLDRHRVDFELQQETRTVPWSWPQPRDTVVPHVARDHQRDAIREIVQCRQGIVEAPTGSGKTVTILKAAGLVKQKTLIVTDKVNIATQWQERCEQFLGFRPGIVGDGQWDDEGPLTIAMVQTLAKLPSDDLFFDRFGFVCLDECHHVTAPSYFDVLSAFPSEYRIGVSATPDRLNGLVPIAYAVLGPVIHETSRSELEDAGLLVKPRVIRVETGFTASYWSTHTSEPDPELGHHVCKMVGCKKKTKHGHRNNYASALKALVDDDERNELIISKVLENREHGNLVISKQLKHLDRLQGLLSGRLRSAMLTGRENAQERADVVRRASEEFLVVFSTLADEALDIPELDRIYLTWPTKSTALLNQQVGRILRPSAGKADAIIYDFVDRVGPMGNQAFERKLFYEQEGFLVDGGR